MKFKFSKNYIGNLQNDFQTKGKGQFSYWGKLNKHKSEDNRINRDLLFTSVKESTGVIQILVQSFNKGNEQLFSDIMHIHMEKHLV